MTTHRLLKAKFDKASGQVFTESFVSAQRSSDRNWSRRILSRPVFTAQDAEDRVQGNRSLRDLALDSIIGNLGHLTLELVEELPKHLNLRIWELASKRYKVPLRIWHTFSKSLRNENCIPLSLLRYRQVIASPSLSLESFTTALTSSNFDFLTSLSITTAFSVPELVKLSEITNLAVLEIVHIPDQDVESLVSDRLVRTWYESAINQAAFRVLRILRLWNHANVTSKSLPYLNGFPILALCDIRGCNLSANARAEAQYLGWNSSLLPSTSAFYEAERAISLRLNAEGDDAASIQRASSQQADDDSSTSRLPRKEVSASMANRGNPPDAKKTWDFDLYTLFSRIGKLRSDRDLARAGLDVTDPVVAVNYELANSIPMASLRLGPSPEYLLPSQTCDQDKCFYGTPEGQKKEHKPTFKSGSPSITFFRLEDPRVEQHSTKAQTMAENSVLKRNAMPAVKQRSAKIQSKRQKLHDVLNSFGGSGG